MQRNKPFLHKTIWANPPPHFPRWRSVSCGVVVCAPSVAAHCIRVHQALRPPFAAIPTKTKCFQRNRSSKAFTVNFANYKCAYLTNARFSYLFSFSIDKRWEGRPSLRGRCALTVGKGVTDSPGHSDRHESALQSARGGWRQKLKTKEVAFKQ